MVCDTAGSAGWELKVREWTRMKETVAKLEVLVKLHRVLWALGASSLLDERLAGDRTRRHLSGPSSRIEIESKRQVNGRFDGVCWRRSADVRRVLEVA